MDHDELVELFKLQTRELTELTLIVSSLQRQLQTTQEAVLAIQDVRELILQNTQSYKAAFALVHELLNRLAGEGQDEVRDGWRELLDELREEFDRRDELNRREDE